jgi:hypothetical protein
VTDFGGERTDTGHRAHGFWKVAGARSAPLSGPWDACHSVPVGVSEGGLVRRAEDVVLASTLPVESFRVWSFMTDKHPDLVIPPNERKTFQTIAGNECRWPYGDPLQPDFYFCGKSKEAASPYCEFHSRRGFVSSSRPYRPDIPGR